MASNSATAYLSLGSNVGDRTEHLRAALRMLKNEGISVLRASSVYETEPQDYANQAWFLNCVLEIATALRPLELLYTVQTIETLQGRVRTIPKGPRTLDIDILIFGEIVLQSEELTIPHPRLLERRFALEPLRELAPDLLLPGKEMSVARANDELRNSAQVRRVGELFPLQERPAALRKRAAATRMTASKKEPAGHSC